MDRFLVKRRRVDDSGASAAAAAVDNHLTVLPKEEENHLTDLPKEALIHVAKYLAAPSRALFAATLDGSLGSSDENDILLSAIFPSNQLIGSSNYLREILVQLEQCSIQKVLLDIEADSTYFDPVDYSPFTLDFGKIKKKHKVQLSDDIIKTILLCIDAVNTVKILRLAKCINITGVGLEPLRGSKIIVQIDLSLVGDGENPRSLDIPPYPLISRDIVLPILDSIISLDGCALRYLQFPTTWRRVRGQQFKAFVTRYNKMLRSRIDVSCYGCDETLPAEVEAEEEEEDWRMDTAARQKYTCYDCLEHYCERCLGHRYCSHCEKLICGDCQAFDSCEWCHRIFCQSCTVEQIKQCSTRTCDFVRCKGCVYGELEICSSCDVITCRDCSGSGRCFECKEYLCSKGSCVEKYGCVHCEKTFCSTCATTCLNACENNCSYYFCNECNHV